MEWNREHGQGEDDAWPQGRRLCEAVYEKVQERYGAGGASDRRESCAVLLVRCPRSFEGTMWEVRTRLGAELGYEFAIALDPERKQAAFLLFGELRSRARDAALLARRTLAAIAPGEFALMLADAGERPERHPRTFERMTERFARLPDSPEIAWAEEEEDRFGGAPSILFVDKDAELQRYADLRFRRRGLRLLAAEDGKQGLELLRREKPDLVVADVSRSGMGGFRLLAQLRRADPAARLVVIAGNRVKAAIGRCLHPGAADCVARPLSPAELEARLERLLR